MKNIILLSFAFLLLSFSSYAIEGKPAKHQSKEIIPVVDQQSFVANNSRIDQMTGTPLAVYSPDYTVEAANPEMMARQYLNENSNFLHHTNALSDVGFVHATETPGGFRVQFVQQVDGYPVYGSEIKVSINRNNKIVFVMNGYKLLGEIQKNIILDNSQAIQLARTHLGYDGSVLHENAETIIYNIDESKSVVAYIVKLVPSEDLLGDWEIIVDATNGEILRAEDKACYYHPDGIDGTGHVFDPDPITNATTQYGAEGFKDFNDGISDELTAQLKEVTLRDISLIASTNYKLEGPYARIVDYEQPYTGLHMQNSPDFLFNRDDPSFEAVNIYYHVDHSMRYINDELGFDIWPFQYDGGVKFDPHGFNNAVNAHYVGSTGHIAFGSPDNAVDLGEDQAVIIHELGHGLHHWITNGGLSQVDGLSEGTSDYWAQSYTRSLDKFQPGDDGYDWFGVWGGMPSFGGTSLRVTNYDGHYPEALNGSVHHDGQMWSSSIMAIYDMIGREACDITFWEAMSMTNGNSSQIDAANAFIQANEDIYDGDHFEYIIPVFAARGYIEDLVAVHFNADVNAGEGPLEVNFTDQSVAYIDPVSSWAWDFNDDGIVDSEEQNPTYTYTENGFYTVRLSVSDGNNQYSKVKTDYISVNDGFYVYEKEVNQHDYSGTFIKDFLEAQGFEVMYSSVIPSTFDGFDAVFLTMGNGTENRTVLDNNLAQIIEDYLEAGGNVYLEGGDVLGYDQASNSQLQSLFGLQGSTNGIKNPVEALSGSDGALTRDMMFNSSNQQWINSIDIYTPDQSGGSQAALNESDYGIVAVQNEGATYNHHTFCLSYAMAELEDVNQESSRYNLMVKLIEFFGYPLENGYVVANFKSDIQEGKPDLEVQFYDWSLSDENFDVNNWAWDFDGDGNIDSYDQNPIWTYDRGGVYDVTLIVSNGQVEDTLVKKDNIIVRSGIFVYEENMDEAGYSGSFISDYLEDNFYDEVAYSNRLPEDLEGFNSVFISLGNSENKRTPLTDDFRNLLYFYGQSGGNIYLEGSDALGFDRADDYPFWVMFGLSAVDDGQHNPLTDLSGQDGAITKGMKFNGSSQPYVKSIDTYSPFDGLGGVEVAFTESDYGPVAVQLIGDQLFGQRTFCFSYAIAELEDGEGVNTRNELLSRILDFFEITVGVKEQAIEESINQLKVFPNPASDHLTLEFSPETDADAIVEIFELSGRKISEERYPSQIGTQRIRLNVNNYSSGIYYIRVQAGETVETIKWIKVN